MLQVAAGWLADFEENVVYEEEGRQVTSYSRLLFDSVELLNVEFDRIRDRILLFFSASEKTWKDKPSRLSFCRVCRTLQFRSEVSVVKKDVSVNVKTIHKFRHYLYNSVCHFV